MTNEKRYMSGLKSKPKPEVNRNKNRKESDIYFDPNFCDTFGTLTNNDKRFVKFKKLSSEELPDDEDGYDKLEIKRGPKISASGYRRIFSLLINKKPIQLKKALVLYNEMVSEDRIPPDRSLYTLLINGCAKVGYTKKAFELFAELIKYELRPTQATITALFNACAESPFADYGLEKATFLREWLHTEGFTPNTFQYHSMIKAFGKLGDMRRAYEIVSEMVSVGQNTSTETFNMLLIGCISDVDSGLYHAIKIIRKMKFHNIPLDIYTFNLLLRAVRDCGIGSEDNVQYILQDWSNHMIKSNKLNDSINSESVSKQILQQNISVSDCLNTNQIEKALVIKIPNILGTNLSKETQVIDINFQALILPSNRLQLFGGIEGFFKMMTENNVKPNINSLTLMIEMLDLRKDSEKVILNALERFRVKVDTDFFNILLKKICGTKSIIEAKEILELMQKKGLQFDIITFGVLSLGCKSFKLGKQLLLDMKEAGIKPNTEIMGGLLSSACVAKDFWYLNYLIDYMRNNNINPDKNVIERLEILKIRVQQILSEFDRNGNTDLPNLYSTDRFREGFAEFKLNFEDWVQNIVMVGDNHPWSQYEFEEIKNKKEMHRFVKFMKQKIDQKVGKSEQLDYDEIDELYNE